MVLEDVPFVDVFVVFAFVYLFVVLEVRCIGCVENDSEVGYHSMQYGGFAAAGLDYPLRRRRERLSKYVGNDTLRIQSSHTLVISGWSLHSSSG